MKSATRQCPVQAAVASAEPLDTEAQGKKD